MALDLRPIYLVHLTGEKYYFEASTLDSSLVAALRIFETIDRYTFDLMEEEMPDRKDFGDTEEEDLRFDLETFRVFEWNRFVREVFPVVKHTKNPYLALWAVDAIVKHARPALIEQENLIWMLPPKEDGFTERKKYKIKNFSMDQAIAEIKREVAMENRKAANNGRWHNPTEDILFLDNGEKFIAPGTLHFLDSYMEEEAMKIGMVKIKDDSEQAAFLPRMSIDIESLRVICPEEMIFAIEMNTEDRDVVILHVAPTISGQPKVWLVSQLFLDRGVDLDRLEKAFGVA